jgi:predicted peptidase
LRTITLLLFFLGSTMITAAAANATQHETGFLDRSVTVEGRTFHYQVYVPFDWTPDRKWPVILFLHGSGERGSDGVLQTQIGLPAAIRQHVLRFPFVVVIPQCNEDARWIDPIPQQMAIAALDASVSEFNGDIDRLYLTGLSLGGAGTWNIAGKYPKKFAAIAPVCGRVKRRDTAQHTNTQQANSPEDDRAVYLEAARKVKDLPIWVYHGGADDTVPVTESRNMVEELRIFNADVSYTEYPGVGHNSWDNAYGEANFPQWLLAQHRKP